jgi:4-alpha-glucanotransferase
VVRIDHFRGFDEYYAIPYGMENAKKGTWEKGPGIELFQLIQKEVPGLEIIAEDLGFITDSVRELVKESGYPGMKVLQFAFGGGFDNEYLPQNCTENSVMYTGTHDNETLMQYLRGLPDYTMGQIRDYMNRPYESLELLGYNMIRMAMQSVSKYCIVPIQDYLGLGEEARMNFPSTLGGNWEWRLSEGQLNTELSHWIAAMTGISNRWRSDKTDK